MSTETLHFRIDESGARVVARDISKVGKEARKAGKEVDGTTKLLRKFEAVSKAIGAALAFGGIVNMIDEYTNLENRLRTVTDSQAQLNEVTDRVFDISQRTRQSFSATADTYSRFARATKKSGLSQDQLLAITESLNQAVALSGSSADSAAAAMRQLGQGMSSGALRGDEFNSVLENTPVVAQTIADHLGVTTGELRKMAAQGKVTADVIIDAFSGAADELDKRFSEMAPSIGQAFTVLRNAAVKTFGEIATKSGIAEGFADLIVLLGRNMDTLARGAIAAGIALGIRFAKIGVVRAIKALKALKIALVTNPMGAVVFALTAAVSLLIAFSDKIKIADDSSATLADVFKKLGDQLKVIGRVAAEVLGKVIVFIGGIGEKLFGTQDTFKHFLEFLIFVAGRVKLIFELLVHSIALSISAIVEGVISVVLTAVNAMGTIIESSINKVVDGIRLLNHIPGVDIDIGKVSIGKIDNPLKGLTSSILDDVSSDLDTLISGKQTQFEKDALAGLERIIAETNAEGKGGGGGGGGKPPKGNGDDGLADRFRRLEEALDPVLAARREMAEAVKTVTAAEAAGLTTSERAAELIERKRDALKDQLDPYAAIIGNLEKEAHLHQLAAEGRTREIQALKIHEDLRRQGIELSPLEQANLTATIALTGRQTAATEALAAANQDARATATQMVDALLSSADAADVSAAHFDASGEVIRSVLGNVENALVDIARTGEFSFSKMADAIIADLTRIAVHMALLQTASAIGLNVGGFATGGSFTVGGGGGPDSQLVAFRASPGERVSIETPEQQRFSRNGGSGGQPSEFNPTIINVVDPREMVAAMNTAAGEQVILNVVGKNSRKLRRILS